MNGAKILTPEGVDGNNDQQAQHQGPEQLGRQQRDQAGPRKEKTPAVTAAAPTAFQRMGTCPM
ncbi:hypothetical protein [Hymenobacter cellulosilyticus]|uniref:hypothetical protein n=1 Tax=Hymenobacter cellulosilyticus TaxID=2932248 RepID=UPI0021D46457|nr:hypothetical protein [Hymenobacter cellulosilyticus]